MGIHGNTCYEGSLASKSSKSFIVLQGRTALLRDGEMMPILRNWVDLRRIYRLEVHKLY